VWAQAELRKILAAIGARVDDRELPVSSRAREAFTADLRLCDLHLAARLRATVSDLTHRTASQAAQENLGCCACATPSRLRTVTQLSTSTAFRYAIGSGRRSHWSGELPDRG